MRLRLIGGVDGGQAGRAAYSAHSSPAEQAEASRALVALAPVIAAHDAPEAFRQAPFLAQLIAMKDQHPQTREYRRLEPREAAAAYCATSALAR
jgi:hypothetical protein